MPDWSEQSVRERLAVVVDDARKRGATWNEIISALEDALSLAQASGQAD